MTMRDIEPERLAYAKSQGEDQAFMFRVVVESALPHLKATRERMIAEGLPIEADAILNSFITFMVMAETAGLSDVVSSFTPNKDNDDDDDEPWKRSR